MRTLRALAVLSLCVLLAPAAWATRYGTVTETFDGTIDDASFRLGTYDAIEYDGPNAYLHNSLLMMAVPTPIYIYPPPSLPFLGNYRDMGVTELGIDLVINSVSMGVDKRQLGLSITSDMGTPDDTSDDCEVYTVSPHNLPKPGTGWKSFEFKVPSGATTLPAQWVVRGPCAGLGPDEAWNAVMQNVTRLTFPLSDPDLMWFFQIWDLGIDNVRITYKLPAPPQTTLPPLN